MKRNNRREAARLPRIWYTYPLEDFTQCLSGRSLRKAILEARKAGAGFVEVRQDQGAGFRVVGHIYL